MMKRRKFKAGLETAGSANIGDRWAMFEAVHGSAPRMIENRAQYADPSSMIKAAQLLLSHIGYPKEAKQLEQAMTVCSLETDRSRRWLYRCTMGRLHHENLR